MLLLRIYWRGRFSPLYRQAWWQRLGYLPIQPEGCIWLHAVSLGEARAALPLIAALRERYPHQALLLTTTTATGLRQLQHCCDAYTQCGYLPFDTPDAMARFLHRIRPRLGLIMETELWPNLLRLCQQRALPVHLVNARLSARSARGYSRLGLHFTRMLFAGLKIAAQGRADARRFRVLGAQQLSVIGNLKFDLYLPESLHQQGQQLRQAWGSQRSVWIAASTHAGEDEVILAAFTHIRQHLPKALLVLVPRHPERFASVHSLCTEQGWTVQCRSHDEPTVRPDTAVYLGDTLGELLMLYAASDIAFIGGSLVAVGGHNLLEPALLGRAVLFGPYMFNFAAIAHSAKRAQAATQVANADQLAQQVCCLLRDPILAIAAGQRARNWAESQRGALQRLLEQLPT